MGAGVLFGVGVILDTGVLFGVDVGVRVMVGLEVTVGEVISVGVGFGEFASTSVSDRRESPIVCALKSRTNTFILVCTELLRPVMSRVSRKLTLL